MGERARISWLGSYPQGMRWDAELATGPVSQLLDRTAEAFPDNPAIDFLGHKLNYRQLDELVSRAACGLQQLGVGPGVHVGLFLPNTPHYFIGFLGVLRAGGTVVNYSPLDAERTLAHKIEDSETDIMLTLDLASLYPRMAGLVGTAPAARGGWSVHGVLRPGQRRAGRHAGSVSTGGAGRPHQLLCQSAG